MKSTVKKRGNSAGVRIPASVMEAMHLDLDEVVEGLEQAGHRPALVLSPAGYNGKTSLMLCCPLTTHIKNYPFDVFIAGTPPNAVLADQVKSLDWRTR